MVSEIVNPILRGFNPDPSMIRVDDDYYIATSTFEWFPGVQIHHSRDLRNWRLLTHPLTRRSQLDMLGNPDSGGVWAPCLSYDQGTFYLIYSDVKSHMGPFKDTHNYLVTATDICGPWSDPVYLNSSGFDPSLFHEEDGTKWLLNMVWDHRKGKNPFGGIVIQQYSVEERKLIGPIRQIFNGTSLGLTEGPHIYKANGYYYLITAEGGTRYGHAVTVARSTQLMGPYEADPEGPLLTSANHPEAELQRAGHGSLVETQQGELYLAHLCGRPLRPSMCCTLGRETAIQKCEWTKEGWLALAGGGTVPQVRVQAPELNEYCFASAPDTEHFQGEELGLDFCSLREPITEEWASLTERPGYLRIRGRESLYSQHRQSLIARRQQSFHIEAETVVEFAPADYQQMAGLICYYNSKNYYYLYVSRDEQTGKCLGLMSSNRGVYDELLESPIRLEEGGGGNSCYMRVVIHGASLQFYYSKDGTQWLPVGGELDATILSDEHAELIQNGVALDQGFTGAFVGLCVQDLSGRRQHADFDYFKYSERDANI